MTPRVALVVVGILVLASEEVTRVLLERTGLVVV